MGEFVDKVKGAINDMVGDAKQEVGTRTDNPDLAADGAAQQATGKGQKLKGSIKGALGDKI